jgi:uncharacterized membrane protein YdbT with pleckstrin-like domain
MSYIEATLTPNEKVQYVAKVSQWYLLPFCLYGLFFVWIALFYLNSKSIMIQTAFIMVAFWIFSWVAIQYGATEMAVTNKRVLCKLGFVSRSTTEIALSKIESVDVDQGFLGRIMNYGNIRVFGTGNNVAFMKGIDEPLKFRAAVMTAISP